MPKEYFNQPLPHRLAHRGATLGGKFDENTLEAFAAAIAQGATHIETDVQVTSDGHAVIFHDPDLSRVTPLADSRKIAELSLAELQDVRLRAGGTIPTLLEALRAFVDVRFNIDVKTRAAALSVAQAIARTGAGERVLITSFSDGRRRLTERNLARLGVTGFATSAGAGTLIRTLLAYAIAFGFGAKVRSKAVALALKSVDAVQIPVSAGPFRLDTPNFITAITQAGKFVHFWVINDRIKAQNLVRAGASGVVSDDLQALGILNFL